MGCIETGLGACREGGACPERSGQRVCIGPWLRLWRVEPGRRRPVKGVQDASGDVGLAWGHVFMGRAHAERAGRARRGWGMCLGCRRHIEKGLGMLEGPGRVQRRPGDVEPGRGACRKGRACPRGAGKVIGHSLGAGRIVGVWDVLGGLSTRVGWVKGTSKRGGAYPGRAEPVR